jgi:hypothetical protein
VDDQLSTGEAKHALRTLATDTGQPTTPVVDEATAALADVEAAAQFLAADGTTRLSRAVAQAVRDDDETTVRRGRAALAALHAFRAALAGVDSREAACVDGRQAAGADARRTVAETDAARRSPDGAQSTGSPSGGATPTASLSPHSRNGFTGRWQTRG